MPLFVSNVMEQNLFRVACRKVTDIGYTRIRKIVVADTMLEAVKKVDESNLQLLDSELQYAQANGEQLQDSNKYIERVDYLE